MPIPIEIITATLPLTGFIEMFATPVVPLIEGGPTDTLTYTLQNMTYTFNFSEVFTRAAPYIPGIAAQVGASFMPYYFGARIAITAVLFLMAFVMRRLGLNVPTEQTIIGPRLAPRRLPKLPKL